MMASARRAQSAPLLPSPRLAVAVIESPGQEASTQPAVAVVVEGSSRLTDVRLTGQGISRDVAAVAANGQVGTLLQDLLPAGATLFDDQNVLIATFDQDPPLTSCTDAVLLGGGNLAAVDGEILQFGLVDEIGERRYALRHLLRGRFDTPIVNHLAGSRVVLLSLQHAIEVSLPVDALGSSIAVEAFALDGTIATACLDSLVGLAMRPWRPVRLQWAFEEGCLRLAWTRCCRQGLPWLDHVDAPFGATRELYALKLIGALGALETQIDRPAHRFAAHALAKIGPRPWEVELHQLGDFVASPPLHQHIF